MRKFHSPVSCLPAALAIGLLVSATTALAIDHQHPAPPTTAEFEQLKKVLVGKWSGRNDKAKDMEEKLEINYRTTAGGSALIEDMFPGTPQEMISVYNVDNGKIVMTHYCLVGNQPRLSLKEKSGNKYLFDFVDGMNVKPTDTHMHRLALTVKDNDHITQEWTAFENGKARDETVFELARVQ